MAACGFTTLRIDHLDNNETVTLHLSKSIFDGTDTVYFCYAQTTLKPPGNADTFRVFLRRYTVSTGTLSAAIQVSDDNNLAADATRYNPQEPFMVRLTDGRLICAWSGAASGGNDKSYVRESTDNGDTWGAITQINIHASPVNEVIAGLSTDGTNVWVFIQGSGSGGVGPNVNGIIWWKSRTSEGVWSAGQQVGTTNSITNNSWFIYPEQSLYGFRAFYQASGDVGFFLGGRYGPGSSAVDELKALRLTDATTSLVATEILVYDWTGGSSSAPRPMVVPSNKVGDSRIRAVFIDESPAPRLPQIAYSDDDGETWTVVGTPTQIPLDATTGFDLEHWATAMDGVGNWFIGQTFPTTGVRNFRVWKGTDVLSGWTLEADCELPETVAGEGPTDMFVAGSDVYYVFQYVADADTDGTNEWHIALVKVPGIAEPPPEPEPPPDNSTFNEETVNFRIYRRGVIQVERNEMPQTRNISVATIERLDQPNVVR